MNIKQNKGFSLIELMVVVAIIGVLATVAVPNFMRFQAKAKQTSAKVELGSIYTAEQAFYMEYTTYHGYLPYIGFVPSGCKADGTCAAGSARLYSVGFSEPGITAVFGNVDTDGLTSSFYAANAPGAPTTVSGSAATTEAVFTAAASGKISTNATNDNWTMTHEKVLTNNDPGL